VTSDEFEEIAALYAAGALNDDERLAFKNKVAERPEWAADIGRLSDVGAAVAVALSLRCTQPPCASLRDRLLGEVRQRMPSIVERLYGISPEEAAARPITVADGHELVRWISASFTELCGYTIDELRGRKVGDLLRGPKTDWDAVERLRQAIRARQPTRERLINYHKNGRPYAVEIVLTPVPGNCIESECFVARESKLADID
jgi:PAS domain S-box-containing protein